MNQNQLAREERRLKKQRRKNMIKSGVAIFLALLLVGMALAPIFGQSNDTVDEDYKGFIDFILSTIHQSYYEDVSTRDLIDGAYKGIFRSMDPYSTYFTPAEYDQFNTSVEGEFGGIGATVTEGQKGYVEVVAPIKGTPAAAAGLMPGDRIMKIDGEDAAGFSTEQAVSRIRGKESTPVTLTLGRDGVAEPFDVTIVRDIIVITSVEYEILEEGIGYIALISFSEKTNKEFDAAMAHMANNNIDKLIVDVRNNPGGLLNVAIYVSDYFVPEGEEIVRISYKEGSDRIYRANRAKSPMDLVVLTNRGSASASEIFAGSIQATGAGTVIGERSFGKGTVQNLMPLSNGGAVKLTTAEYKLKDGIKVHGVGITPNIEVGKMVMRDALAPLVPANGPTTLNVYAAQQRLALMGYDVTADGSFTQSTREAVKAFQEANGLEVSTRLNIPTLEAIERVISNPSAVQLEAAIDYLLNK